MCLKSHNIFTFFIFRPFLHQLLLVLSKSVNDRCLWGASTWRGIHFRWEDGGLGGYSHQTQFIIDHAWAHILWISWTTLWQTNPHAVADRSPTRKASGKWKQRSTQVSYAALRLICPSLSQTRTGPRHMFNTHLPSLNSTRSHITSLYLHINYLYHKNEQLKRPMITHANNRVTTIHR